MFHDGCISSRRALCGFLWTSTGTPAHGSQRYSGSTPAHLNQDLSCRVSILCRAKDASREPGLDFSVLKGPMNITLGMYPQARIQCYKAQFHFNSLSACVAVASNPPESGALAGGSRVHYNSSWALFYTFVHMSEQCPWGKDQKPNACVFSFDMCEMLSWQSQFPHLDVKGSCACYLQQVTLNDSHPQKQSLYAGSLPMAQPLVQWP